MTRIPALLGAPYDDAADLPSSLDSRAKRLRARHELEIAEAAGDGDIAELMWWEMGLLDLVLAPQGSTSPYGGGEYDSYAAHYRITPETVEHARERAAETRDVIMRLHYLGFVLLRSEPRGRGWIDLQREFLASWRMYADGCRANARDDAQGRLVGVDIERALQGMDQLLPRAGVVRGQEAEDWAAWIIGMAEDSRSFPASPEESEWMRHRWVADFLGRLVLLPPESSSDGVRARALAMLEEAGRFFEAEPLFEHFERRVVEREADLRKHWGEENTHRTMTRRSFDAILRRAQFHAGTGDGGQSLAAHWFREARRLAEEQRQYFTAQEIVALGLAEQSAIDQAIAGGEFKEMRTSVEVPAAVVDGLVKATPEATVDALVVYSVASVPDFAVLAQSASNANAGSPLLALIPRSVIGPGKVVGESLSEAGNLDLDVERWAGIQARIAGEVMAVAIARASAEIGLTGGDLARPLHDVGLDPGSLEILRAGCERLVAGDHVSATHILVPHIEDVLRQLLKARGVHTTEYRPTDPAAGTSRTDDATLGALLRRTLPDGRPVRTFLGDDVWDHSNSTLNSQTGLNLRNDFAHGLARPQHCVAGVSCIALSLLYVLCEIAERP